MKCCRCGICCLAEPCKLAKDFLLGHKEGPCIMLSFAGDIAVCGMYERACENSPKDIETFKHAFGFNTGCCLRGTAKNIETGVDVPIAEMPGELKRGLAKRAREADIAILKRS